MITSKEEKIQVFVNAAEQRVSFFSAQQTLKPSDLLQSVTQELEEGDEVTERVSEEDHHDHSQMLTDRLEGDKYR